MSTSDDLPCEPRRGTGVRGRRRDFTSGTDGGESNPVWLRTPTAGTDHGHDHASHASPQRVSREQVRRRAPRRRAAIGGRRTPQMAPARRGGHPAPRGTGQQPGPHQERLAHLLHRVRLLPHRHGERGQARPARRRTSRPARVSTARSSRSRPSSSTSYTCSAARAVATVTTPSRADLGEVAHPAQQPVGDARRAARPAGDLGGALVGDRHAEDARRAVQQRAPGRPARRSPGARRSRTGPASARSAARPGWSRRPA